MQTPAPRQRFFLRLLGCALVALSLAYGAVSWYLGLRIEALVRDAHAQANAWAATHWGVSIQIDDYQRGVFSSTARAHIRPATAGAHALAALPFDALHIEHRIAHGPISGWRLGLASMHSALLPGSPDAPDALDNADPPGADAQTRIATLQGHLSLGRQAQLHWQMPAGRWPIRIGGTQPGMALELALDLGALDLQQTLALRDHPPAAYSSRLDWQGLTLSDAHGPILEIRRVQGQADYTRAAHGPHSYQGGSTYRVEHLRLAPDAAEAAASDSVEDALSAHNLQLLWRMRHEGDALQIDAQLQADALHATLDDGMGRTVRSEGPLQLALGLGPLALPHLEQAGPELLVLRQQARIHGDMVNALAQWPLARQQHFSEHLAALVKGAQLRLDALELQLPQGPLRSKAALGAPALSAIDLAYLPYSLLPKLQGQWQWQVPEAVAAQWLDTDTLLAQGMLTRNGDGGNAQLQTQLQYQGGLFSLNGRPFDPALIDQWLR